MYLLNNIPYQLNSSFEEINIDLKLRKQYSDKLSYYSSYRYSEIYLFGKIFESVCYLWFSKGVLDTIEYRIQNKFYKLFKESINAELPNDKKLSQDPFLKRPQLYTFFEKTAISLVELNQDFFLLRLSRHPSLPRINVKK